MIHSLLGHFMTVLCVTWNSNQTDHVRSFFVS